MSHVSTNRRVHGILKQVCGRISAIIQNEIERIVKTEGQGVKPVTLRDVELKLRLFPIHCNHDGWRNNSPAGALKGAKFPINLNWGEKHYLVSSFIGYDDKEEGARRIRRHLARCEVGQQVVQLSVHIIL